MPADSARSSCAARVCVSSWKTWTAISAATTAASTIPTRNSAGSRKRSDRKNTVLRGGRRGRGLVPDPPHGHARRRAAELLPQLPNVNVDRARVTGKRVAPRALEQLVAREDEAAMVEELPQQVELLRGETDLLVPDMALPAAGVESEIAVVERGEHEDRQVAAFADPPADLHPVEVGEHQVENHERRLLRLDEAERLTAARGREDVEAVLP